MPKERDPIKLWNRPDTPPPLTSIYAELETTAEVRNTSKNKKKV